MLFREILLKGKVTPLFKEGKHVTVMKKTDILVALYKT